VKKGLAVVMAEGRMVVSAAMKVAAMVAGATAVERVT